MDTRIYDVIVGNITGAHVMQQILTPHVGRQHHASEPNNALECHSSSEYALVHGSRQR